MNVLNVKKLESLLVSKWAEFLDRQQIMRLTLEYARDREYKLQLQKSMPTHTKLSVTHFGVTDNGFEIWIEFTVPKGKEVVMGTHILDMNLHGEVQLRDSYGTRFVAEN